MDTTGNNFSIEEDEFLDDELDELMKKFEKFEEEMESAHQGLDKLFNLHDFTLELYEKLDECMGNLKQLEKIIPNISDSDVFLLGCFYCNICSALEGFTHEFVSILIKNEVDIDEDSLVSSANNNLGKKRKLLNNINEIIEIYKNKTINNPFEIAELCNSLFHLNINYNEAKFKKNCNDIIRVRNSFTHNNGYNNGVYINLSKSDVRNLLSFVEQFINIVTKKIIDKFDQQLSDVLDRHGFSTEQE